MHDPTLQQQLKRAVKKLIVVWIRYGKNCESFFREQADSLYFDELSLIDQTMNETTGAFSIVKMMERANSGANTSANMSLVMDGQRDSLGASMMLDPENNPDELERSRLL